MTVLQHKKLNKYNGIFIANMISRQGEKYSYGKQAQLNVTKREGVFYQSMMRELTLGFYGRLYEATRSQIIKRSP